ncbi:VOC family protein [Dactylosporangium sp. NPDC051485]|uniref:VOC family protein n=1 Tax=Dactylosporangium sp. NPDC051485 TaxID=3154846 RepID=UPI003431D5C4
MEPGNDNLTSPDRVEGGAPPADVVARLSHFGICVADLDRSKRFYTGAFGFQETYSRVVGNDFARLMQRLTYDVEICIMSLDGRLIELIHHRTPPASVEPLRPTNTVGLTHVAIYVPEVKPAMRRVDEFGGRALPDTFTRLVVNGEEREYVCVLDPDEVRIELIQGMPLG